jgi:putative ABC transport system permease protein
MLRNYLITALRNLERNRLYAAITIFGLAAAFAVAILIGQFVRNELTYDHWIPGYQRIYKITNTLAPLMPGAHPLNSAANPSALAAELRSDLSGAADVARLMGTSPPLRRSAAEPARDEKTIAWADPNIFKVLPLPALAGNLDTALQQPDTAVITRAMARKYFGKDLPIGETLQVQASASGPQFPGFGPPVAPGSVPWHELRITAVLKDLPSNTNLNTQIFLSGRSAYSNMASQDAGPPNWGQITVSTYVRLAPSASAANLQRALEAAARRANAAPGLRLTFHAVPLGDAHLTPLDSALPGSTGSRSVAYSLAGVGALIVLVAAINFVTLLTARAARRGVEVGVRKAVGAARNDLMVQFIGETLIQVAFATVIGGALADALFKPVGAVIQRDLALDFVHDPVLLASVLGAALVIGFLASIYPALVLSSFRPAAVLKGEVQASGSPLARSAMVVVQFAILVGLIVTTTTLYRQTHYALSRGFGSIDSKLMLGVFTSCDNAFAEEVRKVPGVSGAACSSRMALETGGAVFKGPIAAGGGRMVEFNMEPVGFGYFELYGVKPLAGRLFERSYGRDNALADPNGTVPPNVIINETAARALGYSDPKKAVGKSMNSSISSFRSRSPLGAPPSGVAPSEIIAVVPDAPRSVHAAAEPIVYFMWAAPLDAVSIRMTGQDIPGAVNGIEATWRRVMGSQRLQEQSLSQYRQTLYLDLIIQGLAVGICAALAVLIACLGLFALSAYTTELRTKEIGVRKVMGADTKDVVLLLLWQFTIPVLVATAIAVPIGFLAMNWWLRGFVYHVPLTAWTFVLAAVAAVVIAWLTVSWQSFAVARAKPAGALRYE